MPVEHCWSELMTQLVEQQQRRCNREFRERVCKCMENLDWQNPFLPVFHLTFDNLKKANLQNLNRLYLFLSVVHLLITAM